MNNQPPHVRTVIYGILIGMAFMAIGTIVSVYSVTTTLPHQIKDEVQKEADARTRDLSGIALRNCTDLQDVILAFRPMGGSNIPTDRLSQIQDPIVREIIQASAANSAASRANTDQQFEKIAKRNCKQEVEDALRPPP